MTSTFLGYAVRTTDAVYGRHLYAERATSTLWIGKQGVLQNVMVHVGREDRRITARLVELITLSERFNKSIEWSP